MTDIWGIHTDSLRQNSDSSALRESAVVDSRSRVPGGTRRPSSQKRFSSGEAMNTLSAGGERDGRRRGLFHYPRLRSNTNQKRPCPKCWRLKRLLCRRITGGGGVAVVFQTGALSAKKGLYPSLR
jgi:hypothetical protein